MKYYSIKAFVQKTLMMVTLLSIVLLNSCKKDDPSPTAVQKVTRTLTAEGGTWTPPSTGGVTIDGTDVTQDLFDGFSITFSDDGSLTTTGTSPVWLREDTWRFNDATATVILRGQDDKEIILEEVTKDQVKFSLEWDQTTTGGRSRSLKGKHVFTLNK
jgi:hypothetical protein